MGNRTMVSTTRSSEKFIDQRKTNLVKSIGKRNCVYVEFIREIY